MYREVLYEFEFQCSTLKMVERCMLTLSITILYAQTKFYVCLLNTAHVQKTENLTFDLLS
jgi:hypothetical protein